MAGHPRREEDEAGPAAAKVVEVEANRKRLVADDGVEEHAPIMSPCARARIGGGNDLLILREDDKRL
jgi:hypothetical protein